MPRLFLGGLIMRSTVTPMRTCTGERVHLRKPCRELALQRGDRVATLMWNHHAHLEAYFGIPISGGVLHTLNLSLAPSEIAYIANHAQDRFLIVDDVLLPLYAKIRDIVQFERVIVVGWTGRNHGLGHSKTMRSSLARPPVVFVIPISTKTKLPACATHRVQLEFLKESCTRTGR